jgi:chromosome partitioning protein
MAMEAKIIAFSNNKGGVGKTTSTYNTGAALAKRGYKVLLVDLDGQCNLTISAGEKSLKTIYGEITNTYKAEIVPLWDNINLICGSPSLPSLELSLADTEGAEYKLKDALEKHKRNYDFILLDTPPALGLWTISAYIAADGIVIPITPHYLAYKGFAALTEVMEKAKKEVNPNLQIYGVLFTQYTERISMHKQIKYCVEQYFAGIHSNAFTEVIHNCISIAEAPAYGQDIFLYAPKSRAAKDYAAYTEKLLEVIGYPAQKK